MKKIINIVVIEDNRSRDIKSNVRGKVINVNEKNTFNTSCINVRGAPGRAQLRQNLRQFQAPSRQHVPHSLQLHWGWPQTWSKLLGKASR